MLPPTIYFLVVFHIVSFARSLMVAEWGVTISSSSAATIGALAHVFGEIQWPRFWVTHIFLLMFLFTYNVATGVIRALGKDEVVDLLLSPRPGGPPA